MDMGINNRAILHNDTFEVFVTKIVSEGESHKNDIH